MEKIGTYAQSRKVCKSSDVNNGSISITPSLTFVSYVHHPLIKSEIFFRRNNLIVWLESFENQTKKKKPFGKSTNVARNTFKS